MAFNLMKSGDKQLLLRISKRVLVYWKILVLGIICTAVASSMQPALAYIMKPLLDEGFAQNHPEYIWKIPLLIIGLFIIRGVFSFLSNYFISLIGNNVLMNLRQDMYDHLLVLPDSHFQKGKSARLFNHFTNEVNAIATTAISLFTVLVREFFVVISIFGLLFYLSWQLTLMILLVMPLTFLTSRYFSGRLRKIRSMQINANGSHTERVRESIDGQRVIKLFHAQDYERRRFGEVNHHMWQVSMKIAKASSAITPVTQLTISIGVGVVISIALYQSAMGLLTTGSFVAFVTALVQIFDPFKRLTSLSTQVQAMLAAAQSVFKFLDLPSELDQGKIHSLDEKALSVEFDKVSYAYPKTKTKALNKLSLKIEAGQTVAFVGSSGGGKTTLVNTLPRFLEIKSGHIRIAGIDIRDLRLDTLRQQLSFVSQHVVLFRGSIAENIAYGTQGDFDEARVIEALKGANLYEFVQELPQGIHTDVGENGSWLSGGQRQRLAIARAMMKNAPILILDEATSALDNESERLVQASLEKLMVGRTTLVIAHRLSTVQNADKIVVIEKGQIVEAGTHEQLLEKAGVYAKLYQLQFKEPK